MIYKNRIVSYMTKIIIIAIATSVVQLVLWNYSDLGFLLNKNCKKNQVYTIQDFEFVNWIEQRGQVVSKNDPMLIHKEIDSYVGQIQIDVSAIPMPSYIQIYYTTATHPNYDGSAVVTVNQISSTMVIDIHKDIHDLRIDLGDSPGTVLQSITVTVNPVKFHLAIVVTVVLIYLFGSFLFSLLKSPDYSVIGETSDAKRKIKS